MSSFAFICLLCVLSLTTEGVATATPSAPLILVSLDGLGWQFPGGKVANTPNLDFVAQTGVKAKYMETVTPTVTWPNHQTYLTGLYPESHGLVANIFWDPVYKETFVFEFDCSNNDPKFWNESEPIWVTLQKSGKDTGMYYWPGFVSYDIKPRYYEKLMCFLNCSDIPGKELWKYRNITRKTWPPFEHCYPNYTQTFPQRIDKIMDWLTSEKPPQFVAVYVDQPDWVGHSDGPKSDKFKKMIETVDKDAVGYLIEKLKNADMLEKVNLIFVADHSFVTVNNSRIIFWDDFLDPSSYTLIETGGAFGHIWPNPGKLEEVYANLTTQMVKRFPQVKVYKKVEIPEEFHYRNNRRIPPIYVDPGVGWLLKRSRATFNKSADWVYGAHGYPASEKMGAIFYARGPAFKKGYNVDHALRSIDVYPLMCNILGMEPRPNNGSLGNMKGLMVKYSTSGVGCVAPFAILTILSVVLLQMVTM